MTQSESGRKSRAKTTPPDIPEKLYFRIGEVARLLALPTHVLRFWETEFPHLKPTKGGTGQRLYRRRDVEALLEVRSLLYEAGYTIAGARQFLRGKASRSEREADAPAGRREPQLADDISARLRHLQADLRELSGLLQVPVGGDAGQRSPARGLPAAAKRRLTASESLPSLFPWPNNESPLDPDSD